MTQYYQYRLPPNNSTHTIRVTESQMITVTCTCGYTGPAQRITGASTYPIYTCKKCHRIVQLMAEERTK